MTDIAATSAHLFYSMSGYLILQSSLQSTISAVLTQRHLHVRVCDVPVLQTQNTVEYVPVARSNDVAANTIRNMKGSEANAATRYSRKALEKDYP